MLEHIIKETSENPQCAIIWLHGLGSNGAEFVPIIPMLKLDRATRFVFPNAPVMPVTVNGGMAMPAWYDIYEMTIERKIDRQGIAQSNAGLEELIQAQVDQGIDRSNIFVIGFSQGGAVALYHLAHSDRALGGVVALWPYSPDLDQPLAHSGVVSTPVAIFHGMHDDVVPEVLGRRSRDRLTQQGFAPSYRTYAMAHNVLPEEIVDIGAWLNHHTND